MLSVVKAADATLLASVLCLLVLALGAAESAAGPASSEFRTTTAPSGGSQQTNLTMTSSSTTAMETSSGHQTATGPTSVSEGGTGAASSTTPLAPWQSLEMAAWYILIPVVIGLAAAMAAVLVRREKPRVFDLKEVAKEMESQRNYFASAWSKRLRNAALLRYYILMSEACAKLGVEDRPADTPHEFIGRASAELEIEKKEASRFADVVDRAHYGAELSGEEVATASRFMESFTKVILGRADLV